MTGACGAWWGSTFPCPLPAPPISRCLCPDLPPPPSGSRGHSGKESPAQQSKAIGFSYFSLDKGSTEPGKRAFRRGWSDFRGLRARTEREPRTSIPHQNTHSQIPQVLSSLPHLYSHPTTIPLHKRSFSGWEAAS